MANDYYIPIFFPEQKINAGVATGDYGHAGWMQVDGQTGQAKYYEYGRYRDNPDTLLPEGTLKSISAGVVDFNADGTPNINSFIKKLGDDRNVGVVVASVFKVDDNGYQDLEEKYSPIVNTEDGNYGYWTPWNSCYGVTIEAGRVVGVNLPAIANTGFLPSSAAKNILDYNGGISYDPSTGAFDNNKSSIIDKMIQIFENMFTPGTSIDLIKVLFNMAMSQASPLILDLNKNGAIDLVSLANSKAYFDIDGDGYAEKTGWVAPSDGLLVFDRNGDGQIRGNGELFGTKAEEGFGVLAALDTNKDGKIGAGDTDFAKLRVWVDANGDGVSQQGELKTLASLGIASINLANTRVAETVQGNFITNDGTFTYTNGTTGKISDVWFSYDEANSVYDQPYTLDTRTLFLPTLRGYGELADLHIAMSLDNGAGGHVAL